MVPNYVLEKRKHTEGQLSDTYAWSIIILLL